MATYAVEALTLSARALRETDRVLTLFSRERGRIEAIVKGVGKPGSKLGPCAQLFTCARLLLAEGKNLDVVAQVEVVDTFPHLRSDIWRTAYASYIAELTTKSTEVGHPQPEVFDLLRETLEVLQKGADPEMAVRRFEVHWLAAMGFAAVTSQCASCGAAVPLEGTQIAFSPAAGGVVCAKCAPTRRGIPVCAGTLRTLEALGERGSDRWLRLRPPSQVREELRRILRRHIDYHLDLKLRSLEFLQRLARAGGAHRSVEQGSHDQR